MREGDIRRAAAADRIPASACQEFGFSLAEFLVATLILVSTSAWIFKVIVDTQRSASFQTQTMSVHENLRIAMKTIERYVRFAGNDPLNSGLVGVTIIGASEVRLLSDRTGSAGPGNPNAGDPDGDANDADEDVTLRYNPAAMTIEMIPNGRQAEAIADSVSSFELQFFDSTGGETNVGGEVRMIRVSMACGSTHPELQTRRSYGYRLSRNIQLVTRQ